MSAATAAVSQPEKANMLAVPAPESLLPALARLATLSLAHSARTVDCFT